MSENEYCPLGTMSGAAVGVQSTLDGQDILIEHSTIGHSLACLLGLGKAGIVRQGDATHWRIVHNRKVDDLLVEFIDLLISLRHERTPALPPDQLAEFTGRPRSTLYRHLKLLREMQWICVDQVGRRIIIRPIIRRCGQAACREAARTGGPNGEPGEEPAGAPDPSEALLQAQKIEPTRQRRSQVSIPSQVDRACS